MARPRRNAALKAQSAKTEAARAAAAVQESQPKKILEAKEHQATVVVEFDGRQVSAGDVIERAKAAYQESHPQAEIKTIEIYMVPEKKTAYYVVNGEGSEDFNVEI